MTKKSSNLICLENTSNDKTSSIYVANRLAINNLFTKDENGMTVYNSLIKRSSADSENSFYYDYEVNSYIFLDGATSVRWDSRFDLY